MFEKTCFKLKYMEIMKLVSSQQVGWDFITGFV